MYEKIARLKTDPVKWKAIESQAIQLLTKEQRDSPIMRTHLDIEIRKLITNL
jgi:hypothetical protein